jgi:hypothetical protein
MRGQEDRRKAYASPLPLFARQRLLLLLLRCLRVMAPFG